MKILLELIVAGENAFVWIYNERANLEIDFKRV